MKFTTQYDSLIAAAVAIYLPLWDWLWLKAQFIQESLLDPNAMSPVGAAGIAQIMPETWAQLAKQLKFPATATPLDPDFAIKAGVYYMNMLRRAWWMEPRTEDDRRRLAQASYNAGLGNMLKAQRKADNALAYQPVIDALPQITKAKARETREYVEKIDGYYKQLREAA